jgi:succinyl-CoA synthetase alpha subunit
MSILINKDTKIITQGMTGKTGQFHTEKCQEYANGKNCFVAGVNPKKAGESLLGIPIFGSVKDAAAETGATVSVIYVPPPGAAAAIWEAVEADLDLVVCITEGIPGSRHAGRSQPDEEARSRRRQEDPAAWPELPWPDHPG